MGKAELRNWPCLRFQMPSRPGEFHPEPLTEPDVSLSAYPARATLSVETRWFLLSPVDQTGSDAGGPPPLLHRHYPASPLLRSGPSLAGASVLSASRGHRLSLFPSHRPQGSQVPYASPEESHAPYTPDTAGPRGRLASCSSRDSATTPVLMSSFGSSMRLQRFVLTRLSPPHLT